ncbi:MAG: hypothetical protein VB080_13675 [Propionicimonas sp.]|uniref:hypothetical protein n=1 Tax=Propionicimonas sp. TaxID=1955623 RepID=UPI002B2093D4|nr:hypothetical protein [Propionicimonas sp.]MEA4945471.1 hypothetical protein [Propionicimonas sp.]MEA5117789.1 hypothetical protein [Propionicimonas sp.]
MTQRISPYAATGGLLLARRSGAARSSEASRRRVRRTLTGLGVIVDRLLTVLISTRSAGVWQLNQLPDQVLKDVDPALYQARRTRTDGWRSVDQRYPLW